MADSSMTPADNGRERSKSPISREFNRPPREWLKSLRTDEDPDASCDQCGSAEGRMVYTGQPHPVCEVCAAASRGYDQGEASMVAELLVMAMEAVHRGSDTLSSDCVALGARLAAERFTANWEGR